MNSRVVCDIPRPYMNKTLSEFQTLVEIIAKLRGPDGCPWDKEQTQQSLTQYIIEESHELVEAIESQNQSDIKEELGDFLFQVVLQAQVAKDENHFALDAVISGLNEKLIRRHPHVFGDVKAENSEQVWKNWHKLKSEEKAAQNKSIFNYPKNLPALQAALKIGKKTEGLKFDWETPEEVLLKVNEELDESVEAMDSQDPAALEHEIGDLLFSVAQWARHLNLDPEACLRKANARFEKRFLTVLDLAKKQGLAENRESFISLAKDEKEQLWIQAKKQLSS